MYRTVVSLEYRNDSWVEVQAGAALFVRYLRWNAIPEAYRQKLLDEGKIWTFAYATIFAENPCEIDFDRWEIDNITTREDIDNAWHDIFVKDSGRDTE
jgi:hypothetical protein